MTITFDDKKKLLRRATISAVGVAVFLIVIKCYVWVKTGSVALQATLMDSSLDALTSLINFFAIRHSLKPADYDHRFGHGKIEALAGLGQSFVIFISSFFILKEAVERTVHPQPMESIAMSIWVIVVSILMTALLVVYQRHVVKKTQSTAVAADAAHYKGDLLINLSVLASIVLAKQWGMMFLDPVVGAAIALYISFCAIKIFKVSFDILMDKELSTSIRESIKEIVISHPEVKGLHDLRTRSTGIKSFFQLHIELNEDISLKEAHHIAQEVETLIKKEYPDADIIIHQDTYE